MTSFATADWISNPCILRETPRTYLGTFAATVDVRPRVGWWGGMVLGEEHKDGASKRFAQFWSDWSGAIALGSGVAGFALARLSGFSGWETVLTSVAFAGFSQVGRLSEFSVDGLKITARMEKIEHTAADAKKLAALASQTALFLAHLPSGGLFEGDIPPSGNSQLREMIAEKLKAMGLSDADAGGIFAVEDPMIARNILGVMIWQRARKAQVKADVGNDDRVALDQAFSRVYNDLTFAATTFPTTDHIRRIAKQYGALDTDTDYAIEFYEQWLRAEARFRFVIQNSKKMVAPE